MGCGEVMSNIAKYGWETVVQRRVWSSRVGEYKRGQLIEASKRRQRTRADFRRRLSPYYSIFRFIYLRDAIGYIPFSQDSRSVWSQELSSAATECHDRAIEHRISKWALMKDIRQQCSLDECGTDYGSKRRAEESLATAAGKRGRRLSRNYQSRRQGLGQPVERSARTTPECQVI